MSSPSSSSLSSLSSSELQVEENGCCRPGTDQIAEDNAINNDTLEDYAIQNNSPGDTSEENREDTVDSQFTKNVSPPSSACSSKLTATVRLEKRLSLLPALSKPEGVDESFLPIQLL